MRDEQPGLEQPKELAQLEPRLGDRYGDPITPERVAELSELADQQRAWVDSAPDGQRDLEQSIFKGVNLTGADVFRLTVYSLAGPQGDLYAAAVQVRTARDARYSPSSLVNVDERLLTHRLLSLSLEGGNLNGAHLERVYLRETLVRERAGALPPQSRSLAALAADKGVAGGERSWLAGWVGTRAPSHDDYALQGVGRFSTSVGMPSTISTRCV